MEVILGTTIDKIAQRFSIETHLSDVCFNVSIRYCSEPPNQDTTKQFAEKPFSSNSTKNITKNQKGPL